MQTSAKRCVVKLGSASKKTQAVCAKKENIMALSADSQRNREVATGNPMADLQGTENSQKPQFDLGLFYRVLSFPLVSFFINFAQKIRTEIEHYHVSISERRVLLVTVDTSLMVLAMVGGNLLWQFTAAGNTLFPSDAQGYGLIATVLVGWWILTAFNDQLDSCEMKANQF